jgi:predicted ATPase/class 3 adenylate cyclase/Tfp pilus assembly protein PilF
MAALHALLLTDIVDSTRLTEELDEEAATALWSAHDRLARDLIPRWRGREIDKTDGMLLLFDGVADALGYALAYHAAIRERGLPIKARAGIHYGAVSLRANPPEDVARGAKPIEVDGIALPMVARVMSIAGGGQTLLSEDARRKLGVLPLRVQSHGHWLLHGIAQPIELFEVAADDAPFAAPADGAKAYRVVRQGDLWQPLRELRHSLPAERDGFVGRQELLEVLGRKLVAGARLVSVLGMGGVGKTRLVTRFAWTRRADCPGGVWFCDLSQARGLDGILFAVAQGLEVPLGQADPVVQLGQAIAGRGRCLVVLDNFEQVAKHAEETLGRWLERAPEAQFIVTTREVLGIVGEEIVAIPPLDADDAVELFLKRANAAREGYAPGADDLNAIGQLVKVLDCLPLAIELAAARVRVMAPRALLGRMKDRFDVLLSTAGRRDRQATLRAAFDWSWELLSETEKATLARMSVFEGGFTLESASAVAGLHPTSGTPSMVDLLQWLVDKSFVRQISDDRFDLLESVREYAAQHLRSPGRFQQSGPACQAEAVGRHWRHFAQIDEKAAVANRCAELSNLAAACRAASAAGDAESAKGCLVAAWAALRLTGPYRAGVELAAVVERMSAISDRNKGWVHWVTGSALDMLGNVEAARPHVEEGLRLAARAEDWNCTVRLLIVLGNGQSLRGDLDAASVSLMEAYRLSQDQDDDALQVWALNALGNLMDQQSRFVESRGYFERALVIATARGDRRTEGGLLGNLGGLRHALGELDEARSLYERALILASEVGDRRWEGNARCNLGLLLQEQGKAGDARTQFEMALGTAREIGHLRLANTVLCNLGILLTSEGRLVEAIDHLHQAVKGATASSDRRSEGQFRGYLALALARQGSLREARHMLDLGESLLVASADRLSHALLLCDRAEIELLATQAAAAEEASQRARQIADELECGPESELRRRLAALTTAPLTR